MNSNMRKDFWFVSIPESSNKKFSQIKSKIEGSGLGNCTQFELPDLRIGTLDTLFTLSDQLVKDDKYVMSVNQKLAKQLYDIQIQEVEDKSKVKIDGVLTIARANIDSWLKKFKWDIGRWDYEKESLKTLTEKIQVEMKRVEEELRVMQQEWSQISNSLISAEKSSEGSILTRDLSGIVEKKHYVESDTLTTLLVIVPKDRLKDWWKKYETLVKLYADEEGEQAPFCVVPRSSQEIYTERQEVLVNVVLFKRYVAEYKKQVVAQKFQVREFKFVEGGAAAREKRIEDLRDKKNGMKVELFNYCQNQFTEAFSCWIHLKSIRLWVESVLRYNLPAKFVVTMIKPTNPKNPEKLRRALESLFSSLDGGIFSEEIQMGSEMASSSLAVNMETMYSYVSMEVELHL